jgi:hypothetical protein
MRSYDSSAAPQFPQLAVKTYAAHRVWRGSTTAEIRFAPLAKKAAVKIFHDARRLERQTAMTRRDAFGRVSTQGALGRIGILVLHTLLFDFLNYRSGRLDPSVAAIAEQASVSVRSVFRALGRLRAAGVVHWVQRCAGRLIDGRFVLEQETNAYGVNPAGQWRGYRPTPETPPPDPSSWGASPPLPALGLQAGYSRQQVQAALEGGQSPLSDALARLSRRR